MTGTATCLYMKCILAQSHAYYKQDSYFNCVHCNTFSSYSRGTNIRYWCKSTGGTFTILCPKCNLLVMSEFNNEVEKTICINVFRMLAMKYILGDAASVIMQHFAFVPKQIEVKPRILWVS